VTDLENRSPYILVADDNSTEARAAAKAAFQIARNQDLAIRGLYIVDESLVLEPYANYHAELTLTPNSNDYGREPTSRAELMSWFENQGMLTLNQLQTESKQAGVSVTTKLLTGGVPELILHDAAEARLLAIGRRGQCHRDAPGSLGHNFRKIAHHVHRPLLVGGMETTTLNRLLLAYHGKAHANEALVWSAQLQRDLSADVIVLNVRENTGYRPGGVSLEEITNQLAQSDLAAYRLLTGQGQPAAEIAAVAVANDVDLIVVGRYRHSALRDWILGSTVERLLRTISLPVLIV